MTFFLHVNSFEVFGENFKDISAICFFSHFNKPLFKHRLSYPQAVRNLASSVS